MVRILYFIAISLILFAGLVTIVILSLNDNIKRFNWFEVLIIYIGTLGLVLHLLFALRLKLVFNFSNKTIIYRTWWFKTIVIHFEDIVSGQEVTETDIFGLSPSKAYILETNTKDTRISLFYQSWFKNNFKKNLNEFQALMARVYKEKAEGLRNT